MFLKKKKPSFVTNETYHSNRPKSEIRNVNKRSNKKNKKEVKVYLRNSPRTDPKSNSMPKSTKETREMLTFLKKK